MVRRLSGSTFEQRADYAVIRTPSNPGFWWGNFLLLPAAPTMGDVEQWREWFTAEFPGATHQAYGLDTTDGVVGDPDALTALGVEVGTNAILTAESIAETPQPDAEIRLLATDDDWSQLVDLDLAVYPTEGESPDSAHLVYLRRRIGGQRSLTESGSSGWFGGFIDGKLVGSLGIVSDGFGVARYQSVQTHPDFQRRGIARRLLSDAAEHANTALRASTLVIAAETTYHAIDLYRSVGFVDTEVQVELSVKPADS